MKLRLTFGLVVLALFALAPVATAQVVVNPTSLEFTASMDHGTLGLDGTPLVARYEMRVLNAETLALVAPAVDLGKPTPESTASKIVLTTNQVPTLWNNLPKNVKLVAKVAAIGPTEEAVSDPSNPFGFSGPPAKPGVPAVVKR